jgi:hypothetical protein
MQYQYVSKAEANIKYGPDGIAMAELPLDTDFSDIRNCGIKFYRYNLRAGCVIQPKLEKDAIVLLTFNGKRAYIHYAEETYHVKEPAFFVPDFDKMTYTVGAVEDIEFILGVFPMNDWDRTNFAKWHRHLPFFKLYTDAVQYDQACKKPGTRSWSILQGMQLGHVTVGVVRAVGAGTDEKGHPEVHQWNYCLGDSDFVLDVEGKTDEQRPGDFSFIYAGRDHKLLAKTDKEVFYVWIEYYTAEDLTEYWYSNVHNETPREAYERILAKKNA